MPTPIYLQSQKGVCGQGLPTQTIIGTRTPSFETSGLTLNSDKPVIISLGPEGNSPFCFPSIFQGSWENKTNLIVFQGTSN